MFRGTMIYVMTATRNLSLPMHGALELFGGLLALGAPFALGFTPAGVVVSVLIGALLAGLGISTTDPATIHVAQHHAFDHALALGTLLSALVLGLAGDAAATTFLAGLAVAYTALNLSTHSSVRSG